MAEKSIKDRMWSFGRETEIAHVNGYTQREEYRQLCYAVIDAVIEIRASEVIRRDHIDAFAKAVECSFEFVFCCGGQRLVQAAHFSELAADRLRTLARHPKWKPRFNVMCLMDYKPPRALGLELLSIGLADTSERVASRAATSCDELGGSEAIALLESRLQVETRQSVKDSIEFTIELMRTPPVRNGRYEERTVRGAVFSRDVGPEKKSGTVPH